MPYPAIPADDVTLLSEVNGNPYNAVTNPKGMAQGGHRQNLTPAFNSTADVANWLAATADYLDDLATDLAAVAEAAAEGSGTETSVANIRAGVSATYLSVRRIYAAMEPVSLTDAGTIAWDMAAGVNFKVTLGAAGRTLANPSNQVAGKSGVLIFTQDATGGRSVTTWGANLIWIGEQPSWPAIPGAKVLVSYLVEATGTVLLSYGGASA